MKRIFVMATLIFMIMAGTVLAARLTADPTTQEVTHFLLKFNGGTGISTPPVPVTGGVTFFYNLDSLPNGSNTVVGQTCNMWGCSADSVPFTFTKGTPTNSIQFKIVPNLP